MEEARAYSNLGSCHHHKRDFSQATLCHDRVLHLSRSLRDRSLEARACAGLGHAARCAGQLDGAKRWHERQLDAALGSRDKVLI